MVHARVAYSLMCTGDGGHGSGRQAAGKGGGGLLAAALGAGTADLTQLLFTSMI